jgi:O-antigen ligase
VSIIDKFIGFILTFSVVLAPWMVGATTLWGIQVLNFLGLSLGVLFFFNRVVGWRIQRTKDLTDQTPISGKCIWLAFGGIGLILGYVLCSALNPKAILEYSYFPGSSQATGVEITYLEPVQWLPQSYDAKRTLRAFWKYLSLSCVFFATRDWLMYRSIRMRFDGFSSRIFPSKRFEKLLWCLSISSAALALVGMLQRLDGTDKLLWTFENHINGGQGAFGPFPYQSNGAQFLNLMWPVSLGFWWVLRRRHQAERKLGQRSGGGPYVMALLFTFLMAASVILTQSKAGALILASQLILVLMLFVFGIRQQLTVKITVSLLMFSVLGLGGWLGGRELAARFLSADLDNLSGRKMIYEDAGRMVDDFKLFGSGAETFAPLYYFYRNKNPSWDAYVHNDYLETLVTFGWIGLVVVVFIFFAIWLVPFLGDGVTAPPEFIILIGLAMAGMMAHARYDLPFQIYSLHFEFVVLCGLLTCLKWARR